jgi:hypothetical protein
MSVEIYKQYKITLQSALQASKWRPTAMIWPKNMTQKLPTGHQIDSGELQDTEALANTLALAHAKAWVDAKVRASAK